MSDNNKNGWSWPNTLSLVRIIAALVVVIAGGWFLYNPVQNIFKIGQESYSNLPENKTIELTTTKEYVLNSENDAKVQVNLDPIVLEHTSQAPKVWVLFLLLSAAVGSLWAILWAVVSLCRAD
jgi:hypothetical protein